MRDFPGAPSLKGNLKADTPIDAPTTTTTTNAAAIPPPKHKNTSVPPASNRGHVRKRSTDIVSEAGSGSARSRRSGTYNGRPVATQDALFTPPPSSTAKPVLNEGSDSDDMSKAPKTRTTWPRRTLRSPWAISFLALSVSLLGIGFLLGIPNSSATRCLDIKGCQMSYMRPSYIEMKEFDTEHTRFGGKYSLYLYREQGVDDETKLRGTPVLFIPGNAGSYKQVRPIAAEAANYFQDVLQHDQQAIANGVRGLDFFAVDFNEDFTAFHGQTLIDQAEYLNEAIRYILSLYLDPRLAPRNSHLPDPSSVMILGHSMGGIVARTMLIMPNYQSNSINTIITMSAPHARAPITFDSDIVRIYDEINTYWRQAYTQQWANNNPLWHVTLISIAGGSLDTVVPSDYANLESLVPETHGFTVFTTTIPGVWTSMDHQAILWCDQFRKVVTRAMYDITDVRRASQTRPRAERMALFRKRFLTGMEKCIEKSISTKEPGTILSVDDASHRILQSGERLVLNSFGAAEKGKAYLLPVPSADSPLSTRLSVLSSQPVDVVDSDVALDVLLCTTMLAEIEQPHSLTTITMDLSSSNETTLLRLACQSASPDAILLPASTRLTQQPFPVTGQPVLPSMSYLQYDIDSLLDHEYVAVVDKALQPQAGFIVAEFVDRLENTHAPLISLNGLITTGLKLHLPPKRSLVTEISISSVQSSLLAYNFNLNVPGCDRESELFAPLMRQYLDEPFESKYFVNAQHGSISLHGVAPYLPPPLRSRQREQGLKLQLFVDPVCQSEIIISLKVDLLGSLGKLYMRYRTALAAFPLLIVALIIRKQFRTYDEEGRFIPFNESLDVCLRRSLPLVIASLTLLSLSFEDAGTRALASMWKWHNGTAPLVDFHQNDLLTGTHDPFFWFMIPLIGLVCIGLCAAGNYVVLVVVQLLSILYSVTSRGVSVWYHRCEPARPVTPASSTQSPRRRLITTAVLLLLVATCVPYQFAYLICCVVQLFTTIRAHRTFSDTPTTTNRNLYNYNHAILLLMLWTLPINLPTFVVWVRNLAVRWWMPFSSWNNMLSVMPLVILVETLTAGKMIPRVTSRLRHVTSMLFFGVGIYAAVYGVSYAYLIHDLVNWTAAWLVLIHWTLDRLFTSDIKDTPAGENMRKGALKAP